jgi:hypothetical protein
MLQAEGERRRTPRFEMPPGLTLSLGVAVPVQIIDISLAGVQFLSKTEMVVGEQAELKATFGSRTVNVPVEIRRVAPQAHPVRGGMRYWAGAVFGPMSAEQKVLMEQLLGVEPL